MSADRLDLRGSCVELVGNPVRRPERLEKGVREHDELGMNLADGMANVKRAVLEGKIRRRPAIQNRVEQSIRHSFGSHLLSEQANFSLSKVNDSYRDPVSPVLHHKWDALVMARKAPNGVVAVAQLSDDPTLTPVES